MIYVQYAQRNKFGGHEMHVQGLSDTSNEFQLQARKRTPSTRVEALKLADVPRISLPASGSA